MGNHLAWSWAYNIDRFSHSGRWYLEATNYFPEKEVIAVTGNGSGRKILMFFVPCDLTVALEVVLEQYSLRPTITVVLGSQLVELQKDAGYERCQRKHGDSPKKFLARVFGITPDEVYKHPIAYQLLQEITRRTENLDLVGR